MEERARLVWLPGPPMLKRTSIRIICHVLRPLLCLISVIPAFQYQTILTRPTEEELAKYRKKVENDTAGTWLWDGTFLTLSETWCVSDSY